MPPLSLSLKGCLFSSSFYLAKNAKKKPILYSIAIELLCLSRRMWTKGWIQNKMSEREQRIVLLLAGDTKGMPLGRQGSLLDSGSASRNLLCPQFFADKGLAHWWIVRHSELKTSSLIPERIMAFVSGYQYSILTLLSAFLTRGQKRVMNRVSPLATSNLRLILLQSQIKRNGIEIRF